MKSVNNQQISPIAWSGYLTGMIMCNLVGFGALQFGLGFMSMSQYGYHHFDGVGIFFSVAGTGAIIIGIILFWLFMRELIADANVRGLEVFYGKNRAVATGHTAEKNHAQKLQPGTKRKLALDDDD